MKQARKGKESTQKVLCNTKNYTSEIICTDLYASNIAATCQDFILFKQNAQVIIHKKGWSVNGFFRMVNNAGVKISIDGFKKRKPEDQKPVGNSYYSTLANLLCVPVRLFFSDDIERDWNKWARQHPKDWNRVLISERVQAA